MLDTIDLISALCHAGKRINMKRVIPYVASQYRKDKIWLRRTKPNKRTYQVLLAIDDSKSMSENGFGTFALEALTLMTRAMSRLDVGELGLLSFGGSGKQTVLHPLGMPFTDAHGPQIIDRMHFDQDNRIEDRPMVHLLESLQQILDKAERRHFSTRSVQQQLHQLVVIIADGRFHEKSVLKRHAYELCHRPGVMVSFIILDNSEHSLLDLATVCFEAGEPHFMKYLDDFPFPYYIVLNEIIALPRTMADLLRQWFQLSTTTVH